MCEITYSMYILTTPEGSDAFEPCLPLPIKYIFDTKALFQLNTVDNSKIRRYFVLLFEPIETNASEIYDQMEKTAEILAVFIIWNKSSIPRSQHTKLYYIPKELIDLVIGLFYIHQLRFEAEKAVKNHKIPLSQIYLRKADKTREWLMSNLRVCIFIYKQQQ